VTNSKPKGADQARIGAIRQERANVNQVQQAMLANRSPQVPPPSASAESEPGEDRRELDGSEDES